MKNILVTIVIVLLVVGCKEEKKDNKENRILSIYNWEDYIGSKTIEEFQLRTGIEVHSYYFDDEDSMVSEFVSNSSLYDLIVVSDDKVRDLKEKKLLYKFDKTKIYNLKNISNSYINLSFDPGQSYSVPYLWGTTGMVVNRKYIKGDSWSVLFNKMYNQKIAGLNNPFEVLAVAFKYNNMSINPSSTEDIDKVKEFVFDQKKIFKGYFDIYTLQEMLVKEELWAAPMYSGEGITATELNENLEYIIPSEGCSIWLDNFVISRDSRNIEEAYEFLNYILEPEINALIAEELWYATPNKEAYDLLDDEFKQSNEVFPTQEILLKCEYFKDVGDLNSEINKIWYKLQE